MKSAARARRRSQLSGKHTADSWNEAYPIGTLVRYWPVWPPEKGIPPVDARTRSGAWELGDGSVVVKIEGMTGGVHLSHVEVVGPRFVDEERLKTEIDVKLSDSPVTTENCDLLREIVAAGAKLKAEPRFVDDAGNVRNRVEEGGETREKTEYLSRRAFELDTKLQEARREVERLCAALPHAIREMERLSQESYEVHARMQELRQRSEEVSRG